MSTIITVGAIYVATHWLSGPSWTLFIKLKVSRLLCCHHWMYLCYSEFCYYIFLTLTFSLNLWSRVPLMKLTCFQLVKKFPSFYGTRRSLPHSQVRVTCPYPEPAGSHPYLLSHFLKIHLNIFPLSRSRSPKWSLSLRFPHQNSLYASPCTEARWSYLFKINVHLNKDRPT